MRTFADTKCHLHMLEAMVFNRANTMANPKDNTSLARV